jgi:hypothetical protein
MSADDLKRAVQEAHKFDIGIVVIGIVTFLISFFPYYTYSVHFAGVGAGSTSWSAWHGFFGWFAAVIALAVAGLLAAHMMGIRVLDARMTRLACLVGFAVALLCIILALFVDPSGVDCGGVAACEDALDKGHGFAYWLSLILVAGGTALAFLRKDATD